MRVKCGVSRAQAGWGQGSCQHHGDCPHAPASSVDRLPAPRRARSTLLAGGKGPRSRLARCLECRPARLKESPRVGASPAGAAHAPAAYTSAPACPAVFASNFTQAQEQDLSPRTPWQCDTEGIRALAGPNGFRVHLLSHSDTVSCVQSPKRSSRMRRRHHTSEQG